MSMIKESIIDITSVVCHKDDDACDQQVNMKSIYNKLKEHEVFKNDDSFAVFEKHYLDNEVTVHVVSSELTLAQMNQAINETYGTDVSAIYSEIIVEEAYFSITE